MRLKRVSILASLFTLGNALCGFAAITLTTKALQVSDEAHTLFRDEIKWAAYFIILAMIFDALDGRLARFARATSDFGGQLDSLADAISFGLAPAFLMNRIVVEGLSDCLAPAGLVDLLKAVWVCGAIYMGCALIRLARFNVENVHEEEAHMSFKGLPSPAAAGAVVSLIIVLANFWPEVAPGCCACVIYRVCAGGTSPSVSQATSPWCSFQVVARETASIARLRAAAVASFTIAAFC
ncbi:MAG: CDP-alcohol phosphatidyltransferase family protein, partial [Planctomycetota bacterium]|nr:CDP-alcohol phosphatidyltransferase family protein [Planctomycetota bacterium]